MNSEDNIIRYRKQHWNDILSAISTILLPSNNIRIYFEQVYTSVYKCVCDGFSENLRSDIINLCISYLHSVSHELDDKVSHLDGPQKIKATIEELNHAMDAYIISTEKIYLVCGYMNKFQREELTENLSQSALLDCFCRVVSDHRLQTIIKFIEESPPFTIEPTELRTFFRNLHFTSSGRYAKLYPNQFSRYIANVLPKMKEQDLESHIEELARLQVEWRANMEARCSQQALKRPAED